MKDIQAWYIRRHGKTAGPYPAGLIRRFVLLGRIAESGEVSRDGQQWQPLASCPELIPEVMKADRDDPVAQERLLRARRWADERYGDEVLPPAAPVVPAGDRRRPETPVVPRARGSRRGSPVTARREHATDDRWSAYRSQLPALLVIVGLVAAVAAYLVYYRPAPPQDFADCRAPAAPGVNWSSCQMEGLTLAQTDLTGANLSNANFSGGDLHASVLHNANLAYAVLSITSLRSADLSGASLKGVSLRNADLAHADLTSADLSYADLTGANLAGARLDGAILDNAIWVDRRVCAPGSVGECVIAVTRPSDSDSRIP